MSQGLRIRVPHGGAGALIYYQGFSEPQTARFVMRFLRPGMTFIDIGAHVGEYTLLAAQAVGAILAAEGHWERAVSAFLAWNTSPAASAMHLYNRGLPEAAAILARRGQPDSAIVLFERALSTSSAFGGFTYETGWYAQGLLILGELYEARGDRAKAAEYYERYVKVFKDPDPPIAAQLAAVREKLARVTGEPGGPNKR